MLNDVEIKKLQEGLSSEDNFSLIFGTLGDPGRFQMFKLLTEQDDLCVTDFANVFNISVPAASRQLKILEIMNLVKRERMGQMICYCLRADNPIVEKIIKIIK